MLKYISVNDFCKEVDKGELLVGDNATWAKEITRNLPAANVVPVRQGRWKRVKWVPETIEGGGCIEGGYWIVRCTACSIPNDSETRYCPACGAHMELNNEP